MGKVEHFGREEQVIAAELLRLDPGVTVAIKSNQCDFVTFPRLGVVAPDGGLDQSKAHLEIGLALIESLLSR